MNGTKFTARVALCIALLTLHVHAVFAAPVTQEEFITGVVTALACETDTTTGITTFLVTVKEAAGSSQTVRIDQATAEAINLIKTSENGNPDCSTESLTESIGWKVAIALDSVIPDEQEPQHPVGSALATFFEDVTDYETIMAAHDGGVGFGVIAQALWLTRKLEGDNDVFLAVLEAKRSGDFSDFTFEDGTAPENWGQFKKAVMAGKKGNLGDVMSAADEQPGQGNGNNFGNNGDNGNGNNNDRGNGKTKDKDEKGKGNDK